MLTVWTCVCLALGGINVELRTLDAKTQLGSLSKFDGQCVEFIREGQTVELPLTEVLELRPATPAALKSDAPVVVECVDGSRIHARQFTTQAAGARCELGWGESLTLPLAMIRSVRLLPSTPSLDAQWQEVRGSEHAGDLIVIRVDAAIDYVEGELGDVDEQSVAFTVEGQTKQVKRTKVDGLVYSRATNIAPSARATVLDVWGSKWAAAGWQTTDEALELTLHSGEKLALPWTALQAVELATDRVRYLSDIEPDSVRFQPFFQVAGVESAVEKFYQPRVDRAFGGQPLEVDGRSFDRGLSIASHSRVVYRLPPGFRRFSASVGIDPRSGAVGDVQLRLFADDQLLFDQALRAGEPAVEIDVPVEGRGRLTFDVGFGRDLSIGDHLNLGEARLLK